MRIVMVGASGFLGGGLRAALAATQKPGAQDDIVQLVRRAPDRPGQREWHPERGELDPSVLAGADAVVNLAGAGVADRRWNEAYKKTLLASRVGPTSTIARTLAALPAQRRPGVFLNASAVGFYGDTGEMTVDESSPPGHGFFPRLCQAWESATAAAAQAGVRTVMLRTGLVLDRSGGLLKRLILPFSLGLGGQLPDGQQWMPWITFADWVSAVVFLLRHDEVAGPVNLVGPAPARNADFTAALGRALHRPTVVPIPAVALRTLLGDIVSEALASQRVLPGVLQRHGYTFRHTDLHSALRAALRRPGMPARR